MGFCGVLLQLHFTSSLSPSVFSESCPEGFLRNKLSMALWMTGWPTHPAITGRTGRWGGLLYSKVQPPAGLPFLPLPPPLWESRQHPSPSPTRGHALPVPGGAAVRLAAAPSWGRVAAHRAGAVLPLEPDGQGWMWVVGGGIIPPAGCVQTHNTYTHVYMWTRARTHACACMQLVRRLFPASSQPFPLIFPTLDPIPPSTNSCPDHPKSRPDFPSFGRCQGCQKKCGKLVPTQILGRFLDNLLLFWDSGLFFLMLQHFFEQQIFPPPQGVVWATLSSRLVVCGVYTQPCCWALHFISWRGMLVGNGAGRGCHTASCRSSTWRTGGPRLMFWVICDVASFCI